MIENIGIVPIISISLIIIIAYIVFVIAGFGTALIAGPILSFFIPVNQMVPLLAILDCFAAITNVLRDHRAAEKMN